MEQKAQVESLLSLTPKWKRMHFGSAQCSNSRHCDAQAPNRRIGLGMLCMNSMCKLYAPLNRNLAATQSDNCSSVSFTSVQVATLQVPQQECGTKPRSALLALSFA